MGQILKCVFLLWLVVAIVSAQNVTSSVRSQNFFVPTVKSNWHGAVAYCHQHGMRIASLDSQAKQTEVSNLVQSSPQIFNPDFTRLWVGANNLSPQGQYLWVETGAELQKSYTNWYKGQPDNKRNEEHCMEIIYRPTYEWNWQWNDKLCTDVYYFVCELNPWCQALY